MITRNGKREGAKETRFSVVESDSATLSTLHLFECLEIKGLGRGNPAGDSTVM